LHIKAKLPFLTKGLAELLGGGLMFNLLSWVWSLIVSLPPPLTPLHLKAKLPFLTKALAELPGGGVLSNPAHLGLELHPLSHHPDSCILKQNDHFSAELPAGGVLSDPALLGLEPIFSLSPLLIHAY
jgi:hypothetical protein